MANHSWNKFQPPAGADAAIWEPICQAMPEGYAIPDPVFADALKPKLIRTAEKICFAIIAHDREDVLSDQVANVRKYNPDAQIVLYNGGSDPEFGKSAGVETCPYSRPLHASYKLGRVMLDLMRWLDEVGANYEYLINLDSDYLFVNHGFGDWLGGVMQGFDLMGMYIQPYRSPADSEGWIPGESMWREWDLWQPFFQTDFFIGTLNGMQVYRRGIVRRILEFLDVEQIERLLASTNVYALEEIVTCTLAVRCGAAYRPYPVENIRYVRLNKPYEVDEVQEARAQTGIYFMHPIERDLNNPARQLIGELDGEMTKGLERSKVIGSRRLLNKIIRALERGRPYSVVNVGATETFVMAQYEVLSEEQFMNHDEARVANWGVRSGFYHRGIRFPNIDARDQAVQAVRNANIVGYNTVIRTMDGGLMTEKVFAAYGIEPKFVFEGYLRRIIMFSQRKKFKQMLAGRRIVLVSSVAEEARAGLNKRWKKKLGFEVVGAIPIWSYEEIEDVKKQIDQYEFDLCLLGAGTNALILADYVKRKHGKVAFDIGFGMHSLFTGSVYEDDWLRDIIGIENAMKM